MGKSINLTENGKKFIIEEQKQKKEMNFLERTMTKVNDFILDKAFYKTNMAIEVTVDKEEGNYKCNVDYHKGDIPFPYNVGIEIAESMQEGAKKELERVGKKHITAEYTESYYTFKPKVYLDVLKNKLRRF
ncbi:MAG: hypothetical protein NTZ83_01985 [Candidatus Pacearchaeota archaeon]|nr:hypothetical protein [Candidatus Pacearchaeota archaeon]